MSIPIGNLVLEMAANMARLRTDIEAARKTVDTGMNAIKKSAEVASKALGALGIGLSAGMFAEWVRGAIDAADKMNDLSKSTGIAVQNLAGLKLAAKQSGGDLDGIAASINKLSVNIGNDAKKFELIGVTAKEPLEAFKQLADVFSAIQDPQLRAALGAEALGKSWASAAPLLAEGGDKIGAMVEKGKELANITPEVAQAADQLNDTLAEISARSEGLKNQLMIALLPSLQRIADAMNETSMASKVMSLAMQGVGAIFDGIVFVGGTAINVLKAAGVGIREIVEMTAAIATGNGIDGVKAAYDKAGAALSEIVSDQVAFRESFLPKAQDDEMARLINRQSDAVKRNSAAVEENARAFLKSNEVKKEGVDLYAKMIKQADDLVASIEFETKLLTMNNVEKETAIALQKLANMGIKEGTEEYKKYSEAIIAATLDKAQVQSIIDSNKRIEEARLDAIKKADEAQKKMEEDAAKQISDIGNQVGQSFADALMNGGKNAADYLKDLFRTLILRPIVQPLISGTISGILAGAAGSASASGLSGGIGGSGGLMGSVSTLKNMYDMATGSFTALGDQVTSMTGQLAGWMLNGESQGSVMQSLGVSLAESAGALGTVASVLGGVGAGIGLGNLISGDKSVGGSSWITTGAGTAIGLAVAGPLGAAVGGALGGLVNAAFGSGPKEYTGAGIKGSFSTAGANAMSYRSWEKSGGWFGGGDSGNDYTALTDDVRRTLDSALQGVGLSVSRFVDVLGVKVGSVSEFSQDINIALDGLSPEEINKKIAESVAGFADSLTTNLLPEIANFARTGESAGATLSRLGTSLSAVNSVMGTLNLKLMDTSLAGASASSALVDLFGTVDSFVSATNYYYQNFYSEQERAAKTTEQLSAVFAQLGVAMPATRDAFRSLVESARAAGNDALFANLIQLAPTFNDLQTSLANLATTGTNATGVITDYSSQLNTALSNVKSALSAEQDATLAIIDGQKVAAQSWKDSATSSVSALTSVFDYLAGQVNDLLGLVDTAQSAAQGASFVRDALLNANATGNLPDQNSLSKAVSAARSGLVSSNFGSSTEMRIAQARLAADLSGLLEVAGDQKTTAEIQVELAQEQLDALDAQANDVKNYYAAQLAYAQAQVDQLSGINGGVLSVGDAMAALAGVVNTARQAQAQAHPASVSQSAISMQAQIEGLYNSILGRGSDPIGLANWMQAAANGKSIDQIRQEFLNSAEYQSMPHFASGGSYPGGLAMVGERGPELINFGAPGQIYTAAQTSSILSGEQVASELRALREEQAAQARSTAAINLRMTRILERWDGDGQPPVRVTT